MKKILSFLLVCLIVMSCTLTTFAYSDATTAHNYFMNYMQSTYTRALALSGKKNFDGYCATCVSYQLMAIGVNTKYVYGNGNDAYANYSSITKTTGGWSTKAYPADSYPIGYIVKMADTASYGTGLYPIVLGFDKGTASSAGQTWGHTMLIYSVQGGNVYFTDSTKPTIPENIYCLPVEDFIVRYSDNPTTPEREFVYDGAIVFYKSAPDRAEIKLLNNPSYSGGKATFWVRAPISTQNCVAIYCDGQLFDVIQTPLNTFDVQLSGRGTYSAYVTACSAYGSVDSPLLTFDYSATPTGAKLTADKTSVAVGQPINFSFSALHATSYSIGITHPDNYYEVIHNGNLEYLSKVFYTPGFYSIFVSCCNGAGYMDSNVLNFSVY